MDNIFTQAKGDNSQSAIKSKAIQFTASSKEIRTHIYMHIFLFSQMKYVTIYARL